MNVIIIRQNAHFAGVCVVSVPVREAPVPAKTHIHKTRVCCGCSDCSLVVEHFCMACSCRSSPSSSLESLCWSVGCCSSKVAGVHHGHKNVSSVTGIFSLLMQGL